MADPVVILGSGLAGYNLAREFRKLDKTTPLVVVSRDAAGFYSKPMLSNALAGGKTATSLVMKPAEKMAAELDATVLPRTEALHIDTAARSVALSDGQTLTYRDLVLAHGADPIQLPLEGDAAAQVLQVNDLDDYARFAERLGAGETGAKTVALLGAGLIGCEFANDLLARGVRPVVLDLVDRPLSRLLPEEASAFLRQRLEAAGVEFRFGVGASRVDARPGGGLRVGLSDGSALEVDLVLSAIGLRPRTELARAAGLTVHRGIAVDRTLAGSAPHVHAIGDCAEVAGLNLPYVMPLMHQARALGGTLGATLGSGVATQVAYPAMPVVVKTPACPTVVCPPPQGAAGTWATDLSEAGCEARFTAADGTLLGFAVLGSAAARKQALAALVPALLG
jgi:rubredoxin-NAD+ reductase